MLTNSHQIIQLDLLLHTKTVRQLLAFSGLAFGTSRNPTCLMRYISSIQFKDVLLQSAKGFKRFKRPYHVFALVLDIMISQYPGHVPHRTSPTKSHSPVSPSQANRTLVARTSSKNHPPNWHASSHSLPPRHTSSPRLSLQQLDSSDSTSLTFGFWVDLKAFQK